ncbi:RICIN domain-containing protein [Pedobacter jamesrossensis]|uniref:RICIN domain-containing protein n=1 Tax=Pedobacter jamesrossensis TaxID=1908238 RepID=A0ABV8NJ03_9SPHI
MKKLIFLLLVFPTIVFAQLRAGRYAIRLAEKGKVIQYDPTWLLVLANACENSNCPEQIFDVIGVPGMPKYFTIKNLKTNKYVTFTEMPGTLTGISPKVVLEPLMSGTNKRFQQFYITSDKDGFYAIQPRMVAGPQEVFLGTQFRDINNGGTTVLFDFKNREYNPVEYDKLTNVIWNFIPISIGTISRTPIATPVVADRTVRSAPVVVMPPSANKLEVDIKTGSDNLETRSFQKNPQITVNINNRNAVIVEDINKGQTWPNNSIKRVTIPLPSDVNLQDLQSITILRDAVSGRNNIDGAGADNWNIEKLTVTATIKKDGRLVRTIVFNQNGTGGQPLVRIVYEKRRDNNNPIELTSKTFELSSNTTATPVTVPTTANASITAVFGTGGDDLRGGNDNINLYIRFKSGRLPITLTNFNASRKWNNFSERTLQKTIPNTADIDISDIKEILIRHTGGGGIGSDNWYLDKFKLTITKGSETKVLIDKIEAPIHYFTGDSRSKTMQVIP